MASATETFGVIAASGKHLSEPHFDRETLLLRTACATLRFTPADVIDAMTVSLPAGNWHQLADLHHLCLKLIHEYKLNAKFCLDRANLRVRITRPDAQAREPIR
jgi:hypothetical protein